MTQAPEPVETEPVVGKDGGMIAAGEVAPEVVDIEPVVGKHGGENAFQREF